MTTAVFKAEEPETIERANRFLVYVGLPEIATKAARYGYDTAEHALGWRLYGKATGIDRPFTHYLSAADQKVEAAGDAAKADIRALDEFENFWFPLVPTAIERFVEEGRREQVKDAFFAGLSQQPEGPLVVASVELFLTRFAALAKSEVPGAKAAHAALVKKGLGPEVVAATQAALARAKSVVVVAAPSVSEAEQQKATAAQRAAFEELSAWYADWAQTLRDRVGYHHAVRLGLRAPKGGRKPAAATSDDAEPVPHQA